MQDSDRPVRETKFLVEEFDDEVILYHPDRSEALCLNVTASLIWSLCDGATSVAEIGQLLRGAFPDAPDMVDDVREALDHLSRNAAIRLA